MGKEIDCSGTDDVVCPYCGYATEGDCGDGPPTGEQQCEECEKYFHCEPDYSVSYSTSKLDCRNGTPHDWRHDSWNDWNGKEWWSCKICNRTEFRPMPPAPGQEPQ